MRRRGQKEDWGWGIEGLVYIGSVHGRHVVVRLVQCLGSFVHLEKKETGSVSGHRDDLKTQSALWR